jgi:hypothetical protein
MHLSFLSLSVMEGEITTSSGHPPTLLSINNQRSKMLPDNKLTSEVTVTVIESKS